MICTHCNWRTSLCTIFDADIIQLSFFQGPFRWTHRVGLCAQQSLDHYGLFKSLPNVYHARAQRRTYRDAGLQIAQCVRHNLSLPIRVHDKNVGL